MAGRSVKSLTISLPVHVVEELDRLSRREHRSRPEVLREAFCRCAATVELGEIPIVDPEPGELEALEEGRQEHDRGEIVALEDRHDELVGNGRPRGGKKSRAVPE
jgi:predicted transcriptional regulator